MSEKKLMKGNEALAEGALRAGCRFFAGYPITPQNEVPEYMSWRLPQVGGAFVQSESEVAAINMIYGAAATGKRTMTSSSSPGISLKQEGISYCAGADLPFLIANVMRGGPGLGNIAGAQGDYWQSTRGGGHGDYRLFVMAPNGANEMGNFPHKCYEVAFKYRIPALMLADGIIGQMMEPVEFTNAEIDIKTLKEPDWALGVNNGRAKRIVKSYDLREGCLEKMVLERVKRYRQIEENEVLYEERMIEDAELAIVAYGTSARVSMAAVKMAREKGLKVGLFRPITLWPYPKKRLVELSGKIKKFLTVEMSLGQMVEDVRLSLNGRSEVYLHSKPGGSVITAEEVLATIEGVMKKGAKEYAAIK
ncbi:MAG: 3-methyl-2-oxobutanoate dehydrogenase subunit VorB [Elusimicrobia bacterium GWF2_52_66]|nr:MAG: 3-methyl-2-oxobutanoate dehydrogenase subunit VorB [Elusimicrobia bacterium GWA2_51_34]OGR88468.1 MAG: 3-methyl-2-oxobutanoate dehydrogenase subunit VorB [Elusimicrobia bacterium GWF2_52_66]HAF95952.1 3-methyl-2-oxobutanoate dehydrogenase subunit beta [Elusimicrobiota bacterium]HCE97531.1 3-methyl-2-oxobutanoate dehydrogenase subunit beta [Elusimicrobiota bacterium]